LKIDHLVINVDKMYQTDKSIIDEIKNCGFPYEPKWGKGTSGFKASKNWMRQYMVPNSKENNIEKITILNFYGDYSENDKQLICKIFVNAVEDSDKISVEFPSGQQLYFIKNKSHYVEVLTLCANAKLKGKSFKIHNIKIINT